MDAAQYTRHSTDFNEIKFLKVNKPTIREFGYALVKIHASSINPADDKTFSLAFLPSFMRVIPPFRWLAHTFIWPMTFPFTPGYEFSGVIEEVSSDVADFKVGDEVFAMNWGITHHQAGNHSIAGGFAEYVAIRVSCLSRKPANVSHALASAQAMVTTSVHQTLDAVKLSSGHKVLILGGSTSVGYVAIQLAKLRGAWVAATASTRALEFVRQFHPDHIINYNEQKWWLSGETGLSDFDIVIDCVGSADNSFKNAQTAGLIKHGGVYVSMASIDAGFNPYKHSPRFSFAGFFAAQQMTSSSNEMMALVSEGKLIIPIEQTFPFTQKGVHDIFAKIHSGKSMGKNVLQIV